MNARRDVAERTRQAREGWTPARFVVAPLPVLERLRRRRVAGPEAPIFPRASGASAGGAATEWFRGCRAARLIRSERLTVDAAVLLAADVCRLLAEVEASGSDVWPVVSLDTIVIDRHGAVTVLGASAAARGCPGAAYLPPRPSERDDVPSAAVYATGVVLLELLTAGRLGGEGAAEAARVGADRSAVHVAGVVHALRDAERRHLDALAPQVGHAACAMVGFSKRLRPDVRAASRRLDDLIADRTAARRDLAAAATAAIEPPVSRPARAGLASALAVMCAVFLAASTSVGPGPGWA